MEKGLTQLTILVGLSTRKGDVLVRTISLDDVCRHNGDTFKRLTERYLTDDRVTGVEVFKLKGPLWKYLAHPPYNVTLKHLKLLKKVYMECTSTEQWSIYTCAAATVCGFVSLDRVMESYKGTYASKEHFFRNDKIKLAKSVRLHHFNDDTHRKDLLLQYGFIPYGSYSGLIVMSRKDWAWPIKQAPRTE